MSETPRPGLYVHVPFCRTKCPYCDFYSVTSLELVHSWVGALEREARHYSQRFAAFDTLYLGGGTPSLLGQRELATVMETLGSHFTFADDTEFTLEVNPDDVTPSKLSHYRELGINRLSLGVQSFQEDEVRFLGRRHTGARAEQALDLIRSAGFENVGVDLIYAFQGQSEARWIENLERALRFQPEHLSCYQMTLAEGTPFGNLHAEGRLHSPGDETESRFFSLTSRYLRDRGYLHYEVSNFARTSRYLSRHNGKYWNHTPYLGLGPAAHSFQDGVRWWNVRSVAEYCHRLARGEMPVEEREALTPEQLGLETLFLGFRTGEGIDVDFFREMEGADAVLADLEKSNWVRMGDGRVRPTPEGLLVADRLPLLF